LALTDAFSLSVLGWSKALCTRPSREQTYDKQTAQNGVEYATESTPHVVDGPYLNCMKKRNRKSTCVLLKQTLQSLPTLSFLSCSFQ
jgi:hypothetical protein